MRFRVPDSVRDFLANILDWIEAALLIPVLLFICLVGFFASLPELGNFVLGVWAAFSKADLDQVDTTKLQPLLLPVAAFLSFTLIRHVAATRKAFRDTRHDIDVGIRSAITSVNGVELLEFKSDLELKQHLNDITRDAKHEVDDLTWAHARPNVGAALPPRTVDAQREWDRIETEHSHIVAEVSKTRNYREIFILSRADRIAKLRKRMAENSPRYFCRIYRDAPIPRPQFVIVDKAEVVFVSRNHPVLCSIKHPRLVRLFVDYFEDAWSAGLEAVSVLNGHAVWNRALVEAEIAFAEEEIKKRSDSTKSNTAK